MSPRPSPPSTTDWITWALAHGLRPDVIAYVALEADRMLPSIDTPARLAPCLWTLAAATKPKSPLTHLLDPLNIAHFAAFTRFYDQATTITAQLLNAKRRSPLPLPTPQAPEQLAALTIALVHALRHHPPTKRQIPRLAQFFALTKPTPEWQILLFKSLKGTNAFDALINHPALEPAKLHLIELLTANPPFMPERHAALQ